MFLFRSATADGGGADAVDSVTDTVETSDSVEAPALSNEFAQNWDGHGPAQSVPSTHDKDSDTSDRSSNRDEHDDEYYSPNPEEYARAAGEDLSEWAPIIEQFRREGYESPEAIQHALASQQQETQIRGHLDPVALNLAARVDAGEIAWQDAELLWEAEKLRLEAGMDRAVYEEWRAGQEMDHAWHQYPGMDPEYVSAIHRATGQPIMAIARASHEYRQAIEADAIARYHGQKAAATAYPMPEGAMGYAPSMAPTGVKAFLQSYRDLFGIGRSS